MTSSCFSEHDGTGMHREMAERYKYRKRPELFVTAVQLNLETDGLVYRKWGGEQICNQGDWIVDNEGDCYTVSQESFAKTYRRLSPGVFVKTTPVWAERVEAPGTIKTREGATDYRAGDYIVFNDEDGADGYAVTQEKFESMYERAEA